MPTPRLTSLSFAASLAAMAACAGSAAAPAGGAIALAERQNTTVAPGVILTYVSVSDSRCPPDVQCLVAGKVVYSFTLKRGDTLEHFTLTPAEPAFTSAVLNGKRVALAATAPPPKAAGAAAPHPVSVKIVAP